MRLKNFVKISDELMWRYYELLSFKSISAIAALKQEMEDGKNPRDIKFLLAQELITRFHSAAAAQSAQEDFITRFSQNAMPDDMPEFDFSSTEESVWLISLCTAAGLSASNSEALRMLKQGAVKVDGEKISDKDLRLAKAQTYVIQIGKRKFCRVSIS